MKPFISPSFYGAFKFILSLTLIASPWIFGLVDVSSCALFLPIYMGWLQLIMAIFSNNPSGIIKQLPIHTNMVVDVFMGFVLMVSPWLWNFSSKAFWPELLLGGLLFCLGMFTKNSPFTDSQRHFDANGPLGSSEFN